MAMRRLTKTELRAAWRLPVGSYHIPSFACQISGVGSYSHKVGYAKQGVVVPAYKYAAVASAAPVEFY